MCSPARKLLLCCLSAPLLAACGGSGGYGPGGLQTVAGPTSAVTSPSPAASPVAAGRAGAAVNMRNLAFAPRRTTITVGQSIEWINRDDVTHNVTTLDGSTIASPDIRPGGRFAYRPARPGRLRYYCTIHPSTMSGELVIHA